MTAKEVEAIVASLPVHDESMLVLLLYVAGLASDDVHGVIGSYGNTQKTFDIGLDRWRRSSVFRAAYDDGVRRIKAYKYHHNIP